jgi:hypothetical protein
VREEVFGGKLEPELPALLSRANWDENDPERDGRVIWLLNELDGICSSRALHNLCVDIIRERQGGKNPPLTVPIGHTEAESDRGIQQGPDQDDGIHEQDIQFAWKGLLALRTSESDDPEDGVLLLLRVLAENPEIEASFSSQWPIKAIVVLLNARDRHRSWDQRKVDNIKERLARWIVPKEKAFDDFEDFVAFLARIARKLESRDGGESDYGRGRDRNRVRAERVR